jgi:hypothetical protein
VKIPIPVIAVVADVMSNRYTHSYIANFADAAGIKNIYGDFSGNKLEMVRFWMKCANDGSDPLAKLGMFIVELVEVDYPDFRQENAQAFLEQDRCSERFSPSTTSLILEMEKSCHGCAGSQQDGRGFHKST